MQSPVRTTPRASGQIFSMADMAAIEAQSVASKVLEVLRPVHTVRELNFHCAPSIGVALFRGRHSAPDELLKRADQAMYQAKLSGKNRLWFAG